ncbi:MAG: hypothetical protein KIT28_02470 [Rubrivivax sp.]|nr:hypothetical protein [Rubrivivax sp.]
MRTRHGCAMVVAAALVLAACGDDDGGAPVPAPSALTVSGTAARGAALAGAAVGAKCASGTPSAVSGTTAATGAYSISLEGAGLPCVLRVTGAGGEVYHSVVAGTGSSGSHTANLSPLTELMVAHLSGGAPAAYFDGFGAGAAVSTDALAQAASYVRSALADVAALGAINPATDALAVGDAHDQAIDATMAALTSAGVTLDAVVAAAAANPAAPAVIGAALAPTSGSCSWLRSGKYRVIDFYEFGADTVQIDARAGTASGENETAVLTPGADCTFITDEPDWITQIMVSSGSVGVVQGRSKSTTERNFEIAFPEQVLPVSEFAGTWNALSWHPPDAAPAGRVAAVYELSIDAAGQLTALAECQGMAACVSESGPLSRLVANASGGFDEILPDGSTWSRVFLYKTLAGNRLAVWTSPEGQTVLMVPKAAHAALPALGRLTKFRSVTASGLGTISDPADGANTVTAVDAATRTVALTRSADNLVEQVRFDAPRDGLRYRALNDCTIGGAMVGCAERVQLPLTGMGITLTGSVGSSAASAFFTAAVVKP